MANPFRILAGSSVLQDPTVLEAHLTSLTRLRIPPEVELDFAFVDDNRDEESRSHLRNFGGRILEAEPSPPSARYGVGDTHIWNHDTLLHVGRQKQRLLDLTRAEGYDAFFLIDSDLLLDPTVLESLLTLRVDIASAVFWTRWNRSETNPMPQVWLRHPGELDGLGMTSSELIQSLAERQAVRVLGGGACCLYRTHAIKHARFSPPHPWQPMDGPGMWAGEDRTMALSAQFARIPQWADGWPDIYHAYHHEHRTKEALTQALDVLYAPRQKLAKYGDLVSFAIEPLEIPQLQNAAPDIRCIRGRLGGLKLMPELEAALLTMEAGETRMVELNYPFYFQIKELQSQKKIIMVRLIDIKPYSYAPELDNYAFRGLEA